jgi:co-chaperonin GroES (HSP10)
MILAAAKRLVVKEIVSDEVPQKGLLILPTKKEQVLAVVVATGIEVDQQIKPNDLLYLPDNTGIPLEIEGEEYLSIVENQILAIVRED